ncbi:FAD-dependent monooxygenase [Kitasatospora sp. LaBMicrA B282]|uniref:FAD-dependent monooxygenase n=1 Tax=Kitasatospora sp. LaBMicrA B282 TaxID=3420949 RepID=UPI003D09FB79
MAAGGLDCEVVVVGAGPTGLALAIGLHQHGLAVRLLEKQDRGKREARAGVIWQRALEVLADLGCADRFAAHGLPVQCAELVAAGHPVAVLDLTMPGTRHPHALSIEQDDTERLLAERLAEVGGAISWSTEAVAVRLGTDHAEVDVRTADGDRQTLRCGWVVGCEGSRSLVREAAGLTFDGAPRPRLRVKQINAEVEWSRRYDPGRSYFFLDRGLSAGCAPRPGGGYRLFGFTDEPDDAPMTPVTTAEMRDFLAHAAREPELRLLPTDPPWANRARFQDRFAGSLRAGRALLAGDSAHLWAPVGGHGLNTGLRGAHNLAWKLAAVARGRARAELLDTYADEQLRTARRVLRRTRFDVLELPATRWSLLGLRLAGGPLLRTRLVSGAIRTGLSDLDLHHRESALSAAGGGDRLPDLAVWTATGRRRLHDLLDYGHWTLLQVTGATAPDPRLTAALAAHPVPLTVHRLPPSPSTRRLLPPGALLLVRPDRHLALRTHRTEEVTGYLQRWYPRTDR